MSLLDYDCLVRALKAGLLSGTAAATHPLLTSLVEYFELGEAGGAATGYFFGKSLTDNNTVTQADGVGAGQKARQFTAANSEFLSLAVDADASLDGRTFYASAWARADSLGNRTIIGCVSPFNFQFFIDPTGALGLDAWVTNGAGAGIAGAIATGAFYFLEMKIDAEAQKIGVAVNAGAWVEQSFTVYTPSAAHGLGVGSRHAAEATALWDGRLQGLLLSRRIPTDAERTWLRNGGAAARTGAEIAAYTGA